MPGSDTPQGSRSQRGKNNLEPEMIPTKFTFYMSDTKISVSPFSCFQGSSEAKTFSSDNFTGARRKSTTMFELESVKCAPILVQDFLTQCLSPALWLYALDNLPNAFNGSGFTAMLLRGTEFENPYLVSL
ncbi:hypothetical protein R3P38DRAFT_2816035 [Favolaschia claudopus]|uniref:Uncharacterized protein n=1 Tax=Favolaschia claudopus TaxID=2862362 RepID=A0AAV9YZY9_9AGAR